VSGFWFVSSNDFNIDFTVPFDGSSLIIDHSDYARGTILTVSLRVENDGFAGFDSVFVWIDPVFGN